MYRHVILWRLKPEYSEAKKQEVKAEIKAALESLAGKIPGMISIKVNTEGLPTSNVDLMLDSSFDSYEAIKGYSVHPEHLAVANGKVRPNTAERYCLDFEE